MGGVLTDGEVVGGTIGVEGGVTIVSAVCDVSDGAGATAADVDGVLVEAESAVAASRVLRYRVSCR